MSLSLSSPWFICSTALFFKWFVSVPQTGSATHYLKPGCHMHEKADRSFGILILNRLPIMLCVFQSNGVCPQWPQQGWSGCWVPLLPVLLSPLGTITPVPVSPVPLHLLYMPLTGTARTHMISRHLGWVAPITWST